MQTSRLTLRTITENDFLNIHELHSDPQIPRFNTTGIPESTEVTANLLIKWINLQQVIPRRSYIYSICLNESADWIGIIAFNLGESRFQSAEVSYKISRLHWNKGYGTEALFKMLEFGFGELHLHRIEAGAATENMASVKVLEKVGMKKEGLKRKILPINGEWLDAYSFAILKEEFMTVSPQVKHKISAL